MLAGSWMVAIAPPIAAIGRARRTRRARFRCSIASASSRARTLRRCLDDIRDGDRRARHPQRLPHLDRADRHDLAVRRTMSRAASSRCSPLATRAMCFCPTARGARRRRPTMPMGVSASCSARTRSLPGYFVTAQSLSPAEHVAVQAAAQAYVDSSISKTINCPPGISFEDFKDVYRTAYEKGCKGCTTYRPNPVTGAVLAADRDRRRAAGVRRRRRRPQTAVARTALALAPRTPNARRAATRLHDPAARPRRASCRAYLQGALAGPRPRVLHHHQRHRAGRPGAAVRDLHQLEDMEHYAWTVALTRMISAVFRRGGDVSFVVEELKAVFDPHGGQWMGGRYVRRCSPPSAK